MSPKKNREAIILGINVKKESSRPLNIDEIKELLTQGDHTVVLSRTDDPADNVEVRYRDKPTILH
jgi:hypothetical protein